MITLAYGISQQFRARHGDINIIGSTDARLPQQGSSYRLNQGDSVHFYIEPHESPTDKPRPPYGMRTPGCHRLRKLPGWFNLEIPVDSPLLCKGSNTLDIEVVGNDGNMHLLSARFDWNPLPVALPLDLSHLGRFHSIQELGQPVNGLFELDRQNNVIRAVEPVGADNLLLLGSPGLSQEATYCVEFGEAAGIYRGLGDFFAGHAQQSPDLGIKPGYCTNGLATLDHRGNAQVWIAWGDNLADNPGTWVVNTRKEQSTFPVKSGLKYRVRHQLLMEESRSICRFRLWVDGDPEPQTWLCSENTAAVSSQLPRNPTASFGLFQYFGSPTQWSDIRVRSISTNMASIETDMSSVSPAIGWKDSSPAQRTELAARFCTAYVQLRDPIRAAKKAGLREDEAEGIGSALLRQPAIRQNIQPLQIARHYREDPLYQNPAAPAYDNVYYCCAQKSGSQWLKSLFFDPAVYRASGLKVYPYVLHGNKFAKFSAPFPADTIVSHLYVGYGAYKSIPKPASYKTFYVLRDPRDTLVSWYYSARNSHVPVDPIPQLRSKLTGMDFESGMLFMIDFLLGWEFFEAQRSWVEQGAQDPRVRIFRYEQVAADEARFVGSLFDYLSIDMPEAALAALCDKHSFSRLSGGREKGVEDQQSHYRAGRAGDWRIKFTDRIGAHFEASTGNLVETLGYSR